MRTRASPLPFFLVVVSALGCATSSGGAETAAAVPGGTTAAAAPAAPAAAVSAPATPPRPGGTMSAVTLDALTGVTWTLTDLQGTAATGEPGRAPTLGFLEGGRVAGSGSCNRFSGPAVFAPDGSVKLGPFATTRMACAPEVSAQEARYLGALARVSGLRLEGEDVLVATLGPTETPLRFQRQR